MAADNDRMRMPTNYVDMDADELQYDGGFNVGRVIEYAGAALAVAGGIALIFRGAAIGGAPTVIGVVGYLVGGKLSGDLSWSESENDGC